MENAPPIGEQIKTRRKEAGLTQAELAQKAGLKQSAISEIEKGRRRRPSYELISKILAALPQATSRPQVAA